MTQGDTDVHFQHGDETPDDTPPRAGRDPVPRTPAASGTAEWVGEVLGAWQLTELRIARGFAECRGLSTEQLEDLYQETALALLSRPYGSEEHLRNALRHGIKHRALNVHRDTRRRTQILQQSAPSIQRIAEGRESQAGPEEAALVEQDRLIVREFLTELDELEQRVFWLIADGMRYRAIAPILGVPVNEARNASRSCERKRERFQLLYDTGRLCGYRAATIKALQAGELASEELARRAFAHLEACANCRAEHKTNAKRLGRSFNGQIAALLPLPALLGRIARLHRPWLRGGASLGGGVRGRAAAIIGAGGAGAKLTAGVATVAVITGGTIGATHALNNHATDAHRHPSARPATATTEALTTIPAPHRESTVEHAMPHRSGLRAHSARYSAATSSAQTVVQPPSRAAGAAAEPAEWEFSPEGTSGTASDLEAPNHAAAMHAEKTDREFGITAADQ